ncbi:hypothetical protein E2C01_063389 [Portunus trituberculatus]|uniref:Uncharacterized protein n=1 Tax=Portunus trituberculatus TaxID=210409 RepID=A0A5B7HKQ4_PORTR|nr:hypothetical protein [Portunus trituberculatus]
MTPQTANPTVADARKCHVRVYNMKRLAPVSPRRGNAAHEPVRLLRPPPPCILPYYRLSYHTTTNTTATASRPSHQRMVWSATPAIRTLHHNLSNSDTRVS